MLYEMLAGQRPVAGSSPADILTAILRDEPAPIAALNTEVPEALSRIVERCLAKEPAGRYDGCEGLGNDLSRALEAGAPSGARPSRVWIGGGGLVAVGAAIGVFSGKLHLLPRPAPSAEARAPLVIDALGCEAAALTGGEPSPELASAIGIGACARLGTDLGVDWSAKGAAHTLSV